MPVDSATYDVIAAIDHATRRRATSVSALESDTEAKKLLRTIKRREQAIQGDIANEVDDEKKPRFSNAEKRNAEFDSRSESDSVLIALQEQLRVAEFDAATNRIDAQFHSDCHTALCAFADSNASDGSPEAK